MKKIILLIILFASSFSRVSAQFTEPDTTYYDDVARGLQNTSEWKGIDSGKVVAALQYIVNFNEIDSLGFSKEAQQDSLIAALNVLKTYAQQLTIKSQTDTTNNRLSQSLALLQLIRAAIEGTVDVNITNQISDYATDTKLELVRLLLASLDGKDFSTSAKQDESIDSLNAIKNKVEAVRVLLNSLNNKDFATSVNQDSIEVNIEETNSLIQQMENRQAILHDSLNTLNATQLLLKGIQQNIKTNTDTTNARLSVVNYLLQDVEDRAATLQDSLNVLNATALLLKGYLQNIIVQGDTTNGRIAQSLTLLQYIRAAFEGTLDVNVTNQITGFATETKQQVIIDSLISVIAELRSRTTVIDSIITIGTTAVQLPNIPCKEFTVLNLSETATVFFSTESGITYLSDEYPYKYREGILDKVNNPNKYYAVSSAAGTKIKVKAVR